MLKQQELLSKLGATDLKDAQAKVQALKAQGKTKEEIVRLTGEEAYQNLTNASLQEKIGAFMQKIQQSISDFVESSGIIEKIESFFDYLSKPENIRAIITTIRDTFAGIVDVILTITNGIINAIDAVTLGFGIDEDFERKFEKFSEEAPNRIRALGGDMSGVSVSEKAAKGTVANNASSESKPAYIGGGTKGDSREQLVQVISMLDGKQIGVSNVQYINSTAGNQDFRTGNIPTQA
jgi:hypothetical protein